MPKPQVRRDELKTGENLCDYCTARCCRYYALPIETPKTWDDFSHIRWYLLHGHSSIFVEDDTWYLMVYGDCKHLLPDNRCGIYDDRPHICREYSTDNCEYDDDTCYDKLFESPEQIWEYAHAVLPANPKRRASDPIHLPVIATS